MSRPTITNRLGLPQPIVDAVRGDPYSSGGSDITVTTLLKPPRAVALERQHASEIVEDAADRLWALVGQIGHSILERGSKESITERRLFTEINGWKVSGQVDLVPPDLLIDYKFTTVWSCKDGLKPEWEQQLNMLHLLCIRNDINIVKAQIVAIYRDWSTLEARRSPDYPQTQVELFDVPLWAFSKVEAYMLERVMAHQSARETLPECSSEERWEKPTKWALMKKGRERAVRVFESAQAANAALEGTSKEHYIQERPGEQVRCQSYCAAMPFCAQARALGVVPEGEA
jgi:hypothetical protein